MASTSENVVKIVEELLPAQNQSHFLGLKLGLPLHDVKGIQSNYHDPRDRLLQVIIEFLNQEQTGPTWRVIVDALRSPLVNLPALAKRVEAAHCPDTTSTRDIVGRMCYDCNFLGYRRQEYSAGSQEEGVYTLTSHIKMREIICSAFSV